MKDSYISLKTRRDDNKDLSKKQDRFTEYNCYLYSLDQQIKYLRQLNKEMPDEIRVPDSLFDNINTDSDHIQNIEDLETFFVVPTGTLRDVIDYQVKLIEMTQPGSIFTNFFSENDCAVSMDDVADKVMYTKPGIYRVRLNMLSFFGDEHNITVDNAREYAKQNGIKLAGLPSVSAYALQDPRLFQLQDGIKIPFVDIAEIIYSDLHGNFVFYMSWSRSSRKAFFGSSPSDDRCSYYARPSFIKR